MSAQLIPLKAGTAPAILLQRPVLLIGRHPECDVRLDVSTISRRHCCVALAYDRVMIRDLGSRNGLRVNGLLVDEAQLRPGDEVAIGPLLFRLDVMAAAMTPPTPPSPPTPRPPEPAAGPSGLSELPADPSDLEGDLYPIRDL